ncbi:response regulator [Aromatoleum buckelii]|nr:response regulator [Aromatoleum buckelii]
MGADISDAGLNSPRSSGVQRRGTRGMAERVAVLAVDDRPVNLSAIEALLDDQEVDVVKALSGNDALRHTLTREFALVLLDVQMPGMDGFETAELMRANPKTRHLPIIFVTAGISNRGMQFKGYELGAVDYLIKPFEPHVLRGKVMVFCDLFRQRRELEAAKALLEARIEERVEQLRESEERFRLLATHAPVGIYQLDRDGNCLSANPRWYELCGLAPEAAAGQGWRVTLHPDDQLLVDAATRNAFEHDTGYALEYRIVSGSGPTRTVLARAEMIRDHNRRPRHLFGTLLDITEQKTVENELVLAKAEAERANEAKSRFLAAASHDLRQPLAAMTLYLDVLRQEVPASSQKLVGNLRQCVSSLSKLLTDLLDMSKLEAGVVTPTISDFPINDILASVLAVHAPEARLKGLWLTYVSTRLTARTDAVLFQRMLGNLIANAVRYTEHGRILVGCRRRGGKAWVEVWDTGVGIPENKMSEIFEEFKQLGDGARTRGSGLGLAIVAKTAALLGLQIRVGSRLGRGSMFALELPLGKAPRQLPQQPGPQRRSLRIALVEDNPAVLDAVKCALESVGHEVIAAQSRHEMLEALGERRPDAVVSDYRLMDGETGLDVIESVWELHDSMIPALVLTGETAPSFIRNMADRAIAVQHKPLDLEALQVCLANLVAAVSGIDPLTGVRNLRRIEYASRHAIRTGARRDQAPSLILFDIDCFQDFAGEFGSQRGDDVLREIARRAGATLREGDELGRKGGAAFLVLAQNTSPAAGETLAESLRRAIEAEPCPTVGKVTASFGVAEHLAGEPFEEWLARADDAVRLAKNAGGNCVRLHPANLLWKPRRPVDGQFVQLVWHEHYCCGEPTIDAQHRALVEQANALLTDLMGGRCPTPELVLTARRVLSEVAQHCRDEEQILEAAAYPDLDCHRAEHAALLRRAENFLARLGNGAQNVAGLLEFIAYEFVALHMLGTDREYATHLGANSMASSSPV